MENKQDKGFTLVELLIVIVILGILATVTVFAVRGITSDGQQSACSADEKTLQTAVEAWFAQNPSATIPAAGADPTATPPVPGSVQGTLVADGLMVDESSLFTVSADGVVAPVSTGPCATP